MELTELLQGFPALTAATGARLAEAATVCLDRVGKSGTLTLSVAFESVEYEYPLTVLEVTETMRACYNDLQEATEEGASGVAILLARELTGYPAVLRSRKRTGFDYWLGETSDPPFRARLEVSGIVWGDESSLEARVREKELQTLRFDRAGLPSWIIVVLFQEVRAGVKRR
ncbi:MAG: hypothetical protein NTX57_09550 [Armatimonadetes bacterium]|nr:hypothetical protein [Armatimonadota bacterium]